MPRRLYDLLNATAVSPTRGVDPAELIATAKRRGRRRQAVAAVAAVAVVGGGIFGALGVVGRRPDVILQQPAAPEPMATETALEPTAQPSEGRPAGALGSRLNVRNLPDLPKEGVAIEQEGVVLLIGLDGTIHGHVKGAFSEPYFGLQTITNVLPVKNKDDSAWVDPGTGKYQDGMGGGVPLRGGYRVFRFADAGTEEAMQLDAGMEPVDLWSADARWWLSPNHRMVTWEHCSDGGSCERSAYDTKLGRRVDVGAGCWVAASLGDAGRTEVCRNGRRVVVAGPNAKYEADAGEGTDRRPARVTAVFDNEIVRLDHASCDVSEVRQIGDGLDFVLGDEPTKTPSAVPLGVARDGRVVVHFNSAPCDAGAERPGLYLVDIQSGQQTLIWEGSAYRDDARMWAPTGASFLRP